MSKTPASYDRNLFLDKNQKSSRFNQLNPDVVRELFESRPSYDYVKEIAIARLEKTLSEQLDVLTLMDECEHDNIEKLSENIFTWSSKQFLKRRELQNCVWVDVLKKHTNEDCLESFKLHTDMKEIKTFLKLIFDGLQSSQENYDVESLVRTPLREAQRNFSILEIFSSKSEELSEMLQNQKSVISAKLCTKRSTLEENFLLEKEESLFKAQFWYPTETRTASNWYKCQTEQSQLKNDFQESNIQKEINKFKLKILSEEMSGDTIRDMYYILVEQYKHDIEMLQNRFNFKLDEIDSKIMFTSFEISKMVEQRKLLSEDMRKFQEKIQNCLEKEEMDREKQKTEDFQIDKLSSKASKKKSKERTRKRQKLG